MIPGFAKRDYQTRLRALGIWSLEERRSRADLIEVFKIMKGMSPISAGSMFELSTEINTRGHSLKLAKHRCNTELRKYFFSERVVDRWNTLDERCIEAKTAKTPSKLNWID